MQLKLCARQALNPRRSYKIANQRSTTKMAHLPAPTRPAISPLRAACRRPRRSSHATGTTSGPRRCCLGRTGGAGRRRPQTRRDGPRRLPAIATPEPPANRAIPTISWSTNPCFCGGSIEDGMVNLLNLKPFKCCNSYWLSPLSGTSNSPAPSPGMPTASSTMTTRACSWTSLCSASATFRTASGRFPARHST